VTRTRLTGLPAGAGGPVILEASGAWRGISGKGLYRRVTAAAE
jgi:hypothetical protein